MARKTHVKSLIQENNYREYLDFCKNTGEPYCITRSNYRLIITSEFCNVDFMQNIASNKCFIAGAMIKRDIINSGLVAPELDKQDLKYFEFKIPKNLDWLSEFYCIDIKSAYATVLKNHFIISKKTFSYMSRLPKKDRLACVGMLAAKKTHYFMQGNKMNDYAIEEKETKNFFHFCINKTSEIMDKCVSILGNDFLFYWVDGVFFKNKSHAEKIQKYLSEIGYKSTFEVCKNFKKMSNDNFEKIEYWKIGTELCEKKVLSLPKNNYEINRFLIDFMSQINANYGHTDTDAIKE